MKKVTVIKTGTANLASVLAALQRAQAEPVLTDNPDDVETANAVVLPGVGAFSAAMESIYHLKSSLRNRINHHKPTLAICLGLQILCEYSEENPGTEGLSIIKATLKRYLERVRTPQMSWNWVSPDPDCELIQPGVAYFANSYRLVELPSHPQGFKIATSKYGGSFISAIEYKNMLACQFHPELSGKWGASLIERWLARC